MNLMNRNVSSSLYQVAGSVCLVVLLCVCVVAQLLGAPFTLLGLLNSDMLTESEPVSEDFSALSSSPEPERSYRFRVAAEFRPVHHLPILVTSVFHPPSA